jgi:hypothetical protein
MDNGLARPGHFLQRWTATTAVSVCCISCWLMTTVLRRDIEGRVFSPGTLDIEELHGAIKRLGLGLSDDQVGLVDRSLPV